MRLALPPIAILGHDMDLGSAPTSTDAMPRKLAPPPVSPPRRLRSPRFALGVLLTLAAVSGLLLGLGRVSEFARGRLAPHDRYRVRFADVECDVPPGQDRDTFL